MQFSKCICNTWKYNADELEDDSVKRLTMLALTPGNIYLSKDNLFFMK